MKDFEETCTICIQHTAFTKYEGLDDYYSTTYFRKATVSIEKKQLVIALLKECGATYDDKEDIYIFHSLAAFRAGESYITYV